MLVVIQAHEDLKNSNSQSSSTNYTVLTVTKITEIRLVEVTTVTTWPNGSSSSVVDLSNSTTVTSSGANPSETASNDDVQCSGGELRFHSWMTLAYACITVKQRFEAWTV